MIAEILQRPFIIVTVAILAFNLTQRRHLADGEKKRFATLGIAGFFLILYAGSVVITRFGLSDTLLLVPFAIATVLAVRFRKSLLVYSLRCTHCGSPLPIFKALYHDDNLCGSCIPETNPEGPQSVSEIDWDSWVPHQDAVLCFIVEDGRILLIHKKTGLGAGKINAPGGRIEEGETASEAAARECREEVHLAPNGLEKRADLSFQFTDGFALHCSAFFADSYAGAAAETDEAEPFWCDLDALPFDRMWEDDAVWLPMALSNNNKVLGRFIFDGDTMLSKDVRVVESFNSTTDR